MEDIYDYDCRFYSFQVGLQMLEGILDCHDVVNWEDQGSIEIADFIGGLFEGGWGYYFLDGFVFGVVAELDEKSWEGAVFVVYCAHEGPSPGSCNAG